MFWMCLSWSSLGKWKVKLWQKGHQKRVTCFSTSQESGLKNDVTHFTMHSLINSVLIRFLQVVKSNFLQPTRIWFWSVVAERRAKWHFCSKICTCGKRILPVNLPIPCIVWLAYNFIPSEVVIHATCNNQICDKTGLIHGWLNVQHWIFQLILQQCCKTGCTFLLSFVL